MKRGIYLLVFSIALIFLSGAVTRIFACSCGLRGQQSACEAMGEAKAVFIGEVVEADAVSYSISPAKRVPRNFVFKIEENFVGTQVGQTVTLASGSGIGGDCGYRFEKGKSYLVYAFETNGKLQTGICTRTRSIAYAEKEIEELRALFRADGAKIYGSVSFWAKLYGAADDADQSLANLALQIEQTDGAQKKYPLATGTDGKYQLANLPAGKYKITPSVPAGMKIGGLQTREFTLNEKGCARRDLNFLNDGFLKGRVVDAYEKTVVGIPVELIPADLLSSDFTLLQRFEDMRAGSGFTNANGEFSWNSVPPGKYYLAANFGFLPSAKYPYPTVFYRAPGEKARASIIEIGLGQKLDNLVIALPAPLATKEIRGKAFWRFGRPAANVFVYIRDAANYQFIATARTDQDGSFVLRGFAGRKYIISAHTGRSFELLNFELKAPDTEFVLGDDTGEFKLVLEKNPDFKTNRD